MLNLFDSHAHYDDEAFDSDRDEILSSLPQNGVLNIINIGADIVSSRASVKIAEKYAFAYAAVGVHPHDAKNFSEQSEAELKEMAAHKKVVAIGEIGLDYYYDNSPREVQKEVFERQILLAKELSLPIIVHSRDAHQDTLEILKKHKPAGVVHCFSGSVETAKIILDLGMYISLGGPVTYKNAVNPTEVAKFVPDDRLLLETDCPYLAPVPYRGKRNSSLFMHATAEKIASLRGVTPEHIAFLTAENTKKLFNI